jgi:hypothetical protein
MVGSFYNGAYKMLRFFRLLLIPAVMVYVISMLAWKEWSKVIEFKQTADKFHKNSAIHFFKDVGDKMWEGRLVPTYEYVVDGEIVEFPTRSRVVLPADGKVRVGLDQFPRDQSPRDKALRIQPPQRWIFVPIDGEDSVETVYKGLRGHEIAKDYTKASLISLAAVIAGVIGFVLQRTIAREFGKASRGR